MNQATTASYGAMPWEMHGFGDWASLAKASFAHTYVAQAQSKPVLTAETRHFLAHTLPHLNAEGKTALKDLAEKAQKGTFSAHAWHSLKDDLTKLIKHKGGTAAASQVLGQINDPDAIEQLNGKNTCEAATLQKALATKDPGRYFRIMTNLAQHGHATICGHKLALTPENEKAINDLPPGDRLDARFQAAAMQLAVGGANYDLKTDTVSAEVHGKHDHFKGLTMHEAEALTSELMGCPTFDPSALEKLHEAGQPTVPTAATMLQSEMAKAQKAGDLGLFVAVNTKHHDMAHMMLLRSIDPTTGRAELEDAHHRVFHIPLNELAGRLCLNPESRIGTATGGSTTDTSVLGFTNTTTASAAPSGRSRGIAPAAPTAPATTTAAPAPATTTATTAAPTPVTTAPAPTAVSATATTTVSVASPTTSPSSPSLPRS